MLLPAGQDRAAESVTTRRTLSDAAKLFKPCLMPFDVSLGDAGVYTSDGLHHTQSFRMHRPAVSTFISFSND